MKRLDRKERIVVAFAFAVSLSFVACSPGGTPAEGGDNKLGQWSYVKGPHGETCLLLSSGLGWNNGWAAMDCDTVTP